ncbi:hypothetical protein ND816_04180 [Leptospira levettii]|uniref:hypothetical protein n=1 Tax=Leptospira levettii TaxID=2023178 RepID=UPI00223CA760|nr:hypothetical protein [Leptospira levettii]MCW7507018.1 hypothetical protein [Leptospira levettii]MCW7518108.1 hypothetical protein [Leptospira levettii]
MKVVQTFNWFQYVLILLFSLSLLYGSDLSSKIESTECPKNYTCLTTFISPGSILYARELDLSVIWNDRPSAFDQVTVLADGSGKIFEVEVAEKVFYYRVLWKGKEILVSRFDLDLSKSLRTLDIQKISLLKEPTPNGKILANLPKNLVFDVIENTHPLPKKLGYVKVKYEDQVGWVKRSSLSDDEFDIRFYQVSLETLVKPYTFLAREDNFKTELTIVGKDFIVTSCKIGELACNVTSRMGESSFGMPEEAVYFDLNLSDGKQYVCEMRRVDFVSELQRVIQEEITEEELDPFINCSPKEEETEQTDPEEVNEAD